MTTQIAVRLPDEAVAFIDAEVKAGRAKSRAKFIERLLASARREEIYEREEEILRTTEETEEEKSLHQWMKTRDIPGGE
ncbi:MAG: ribbon-helix-helix protein, CopG family [Mobiluncus porci]|uniref:Ribbon-helix-helix protein, CopG family n=1 Tax=Mobiluncus porci TaxID=2652278 RepID=A0A7K0K4Z9_9ACTO|nr:MULTISPECIES: ribbon-helix-helix protein, CopG family [Mobiluncus]MCI6585145.1 ribbon-helix-helix domain-containing protein [Mobiluncus sp.]MDD7541755.1 ribbon-helix-helix protein, CopG family [Mobiluncus porci]MDY5748003.1 ribbon-helix-helix protein, CopG family [Mobiluncus porci]MST50552.1 ribbon-helix-helix protein, CopG family [Mobiluncus porci]